MRQFVKLASLVGLVATILPSLLGFFGAIDLELVKWLTLGGTILWFIVTPLWIGKKLPIDAEEVEI